MSNFTKSDLVYNDYSWTARPNDDPEIIGKKDTTFLNRKEGYEVLDFINAYMRENKLRDKANFQKIEKLIHDKLPGDIREKTLIMRWLAENWK